jgi:hypothetical protein
MIEAIRVSNIREIIYWGDAFRVLGIKRCQPLLPRIGVSSAISSQPAGLVEAGLHFWRHTWEGIRRDGVRVNIGYADPAFPENYRFGVESLLRDTFALIERHYSEEDSLSLYQWVNRFFIDQEQVNLWFTWSMLFSLPCEVQSDLFEHAPEIVPRIRETIAGHFGQTVQVNDADYLASAERIPLSTLEKRMIALEVTQPGDFPEVDLAGLLKNLVQYNHAYQVWNQLDSYLSTSDREALLWWGYEQATTLGISAEDVNLPILP